MTGWTDVIGWTLVHFTWQGTLIALIAAGVLRALRQAAASTRYATACAGLIVASVMPWLTAAVLITPAAGRIAIQPARAILVTAPVVPVSDRKSEAVNSVGARLTSLAPRAIPDTAISTGLNVIVTLWVLGVLLLTARLASGWWSVHRLHGHAMAAPASEWLAPATRIATRLGLRRLVHVVDSLDVDAPAVIGWLQPVVLLPVAAMSNLTPAQVQAILAHELAHIRRHDFVVNLLQTIAETVLFYHPAVWWLSARIRAEREHCCDDIAVAVCGDAVGYAEALTMLASRGERNDVASGGDSGSSLALAVTGGPLLHRVRRLLRVPNPGAPPPVIPLVVAATVLVVMLTGALMVTVAQAPEPQNGVHTRSRLGPGDINQFIGFELFPGPIQYATDDPRGARAWDVTVAYPGGEMPFVGFTGRSVVRYAYALENIPVVEDPRWLDTESLVIRAETSTENPEDEDLRAAIRAELEARHGIAIRNDVRLFPVYGLQLARNNRLGPGVQPSSIECYDSRRDRLETIAPSLRGHGEAMHFCGIDETLTGITGRRATFAQLASALRGGRLGIEDEQDWEVVDQTGLTGVYDFALDVGLLPLSVIASAHPTLALGFGPMIRTPRQALEEQMGLRLVPSEDPRDVAVIVTTRQQLHVKAAPVE